MPTYAIFNNTEIINVIIADSIEIAEELVTPEFEAIEVVDGVPWMGWTLEENGWRPPSPYPSWIWDGSAWIAPIPVPTDLNYNYEWNEENGSWDSIPIIELDPLTTEEPWTTTDDFIV